MVRSWQVSVCVGVLVSAAGCGEAEDVTPVRVNPATAGQSAEPDVSGATQARAVDVEGSSTSADADERTAQPALPDGQDPPSDRPRERPRTRPAAGEIAAGGLWVIDSAGEGVGVLVRRGSDDNLVYRAIYDLVTVYHPGSGLFFEITMTDAKVRRPSTTFFSSASCNDPIGISYGGCAECRSGPGTSLLHEGAWYRVTAGITFEVATAGSTLGSGLEESCSSHHTDSAKIFPVTEVNGPTPPTSFTPPLHIAWQ
jgi:hypothetical protein